MSSRGEPGYLWRPFEAVPPILSDTLPSVLVCSQWTGRRFLFCNRRGTTHCAGGVNNVRRGCDELPRPLLLIGDFRVRDCLSAEERFFAIAYSCFAPK